MARVLVVDDDRAIRELVRCALECEGHEVTVFRDGVEILTYLRAGTPDDAGVILMDVMMPHMDGREVCRQLTLEPGLLGRRTLILMSAALIRGEPVPSPAMSYLPKPFNLEQLYALVRLLEMAATAGSETEPDRQTLLAS